MFEKIISGGQTGVDRAALDVALKLGISCGGWCPKGRKAEDGKIGLKYPLKETNSNSYSVRTRKNVKDSDGTLVLTWGPPTGGTFDTIESAEKFKEPFWVVDLRESSSSDVEKVLEWGKANKVNILNVAGPRESNAPGIYASAVKFLTELFSI